MKISAEERLASLETLVVEQNAKLQKSLKITIVVYLVLVVLVFAYTFYAAGKIQELTSREEVAAMLGAEIKEQLPIQRQALMQRLNDNSQQMAKDSVESLVNAIPTLGDQVQSMLDHYTDQLVEDLQSSVMPAFSDYIKQDAAEIKEQFANLTDEEVVQGTVELMIDVIEQEMDKHINASFVASLEELQMRVTKLADPEAKLTKKEDSERRVIMYWSYLNEVTEMGDSPLKAIFRELNDRYRFFSGEDLEQLNAPLDGGEDVKGAIEAE